MTSLGRADPPTGQRTRSLVLMVLALLVTDGTSRLEAAEPLRLHVNTSTIEISPVLLAIEKIHGEPVVVRSGGIPDLFREGAAQVATNAETQALRVSVDNPDLRIILTVSEGLYRIKAQGHCQLRAARGHREDPGTPGAPGPGGASARAADRCAGAPGAVQSALS